MTQGELDGLMRGALLGALELEWPDVLEPTPAMQPSKRHQQETKRMLADPMAWYRKKTRPMWKKTLRTVAAIFIACTVTLGAVMLANPTARAVILQWVVEWYETHVVYRYSGEASLTEMPQYGISALPNGYAEVDRSGFPGYVSVTYQNADGSVLYLDYTHIQQGAATVFVTEDMVVSDIVVNGFSGHLYLSEMPEQGSAVTWIDSTQNIQFTVDGFADESGLLHMAESLILEKTTK